MTCSRCQHENPRGQKFCGECGTSLLSPVTSTPPAPSYPEVQRALAEALEQQTATSEILRVIASSPADVRPVFDMIARSVVRLCDGLTAGVFRFDGALVHLAALHNFSPEAGQVLERAYPMEPNRANLSARAILDRATVHVPDVEADPEASSSRSLGRATGYRSVLAVPMLHGGIPIGVISVGRAQVGSFSDRQIELVKTFADQAVIAIENARLLSESQERNRALVQAHAQVTEALEQQTATAEILQVISGSPTDIQPVLGAIAENATRLCDARDVSIALAEDDVLKVVASFGTMARWWPDEGVPITHGSVTGRAFVDRQPVHVHDLAAARTRSSPWARSISEQAGIGRTSPSPCCGKASRSGSSRSGGSRSARSRPSRSPCSRPSPTRR